jgi:hypothetical protein
MGEAIEVQQVVGFGHTQAVVTNTIFFLRNCQIVTADAVQFIRKTVLVDTCRVLFDKVLLTGRLRKEVAFRETPVRPGNVASVGSALAEEHFETIIDVRKARPGDACVVVKAFVEGEEEKPLIQAPCGGIKGLVDSSVLFLCVKVVRPAMIESLDHPQCDCCDSDSDDDSWRDESCDHDFSQTWSADCSSSDTGQVDLCCWEPDHRKRRVRRCKGCPKRRTSGLVSGANGRVPDAKPGPTPGSFIGPTILFPGLF